MDPKQDTRKQDLLDIELEFDLLPSRPRVEASTGRTVRKYSWDLNQLESIALRLPPDMKTPDHLQKPKLSQPAIPASHRKSVGYFMRRIFALYTDMVWVLALLLMGGIFWIHQASEELVEETISLSVHGLEQGLMIWIQLFWLVAILQETFFGCTFGQYVFGLKITGNALQRFLRAVLFPISFLLGGVFRALAAKDGGMWHDEWSGALIKCRETLT